MVAEKKKRGKRIFIGIILVLAVLLLLVFIIASPLIKHLIEKYDTKYTGREITVGSVFLNPIAGSATARNLKLYEKNGDSVFASVKSMYVNVGLLKLLSGTYDISSLKITKPVIHITRKDTTFNFSDLMQRFAKTDTVQKKKLHLNIRNIKVKQGSLSFTDLNVPVTYNIDSINFSSPGVFWDVDTISGEFSLIPDKGLFSGNFTFNQNSYDYRVAMNLENFNLGMFENYIRKIGGSGRLRADVNMKLNVEGNIHEPMKFKSDGRIEVDDFHFGADTTTDYASFNRFLLNIRQLDLADKKLYFDSIILDKPAILYQIFDTLDNFRRIFRPHVTAKAAEKADSVSYFTSLEGADYFINKLALNDGKIEVNDYSIAEKFSMIINQFNINADSVDKLKKRVKVTLKGKMIPAGSFNAALSMNPRNEKYFDFNYQFQNIPATIFNPYIITYTSYQLDRGTIEMHGDWSVRDNAINAFNHFVVIDPRDTRRVKGKVTKRVPLPLIMAFVRERGSVIDYEIPVKGSLKDPKFKLGDVITDIIKNILVKPPTTPYRINVKNVENKVEKTLTVTWKMRQTSIDADQEKFLKRIAGFLKDNPEAVITVQPIVYEEKEKENILLFEAKKKYFYESKGEKVRPLSKDDSMKVENLSSKDHAFVKYINSKIKNPDLLTIQERCYRYLDKGVVDKQFRNMVEARKNSFMKYFRDTKSDKQVEFFNMKNEIPVNWFSYYDINYKGDVPESLSKAFEKLYEFNSEPPRRKYFNLRRE
jgi:hypothetical protein